MGQGSSRPSLSALFVDYDNIYLSLKRKNEEAAKRFAKNAGLWLREIESGALITPTNAPVLPPERRIVMNRCYGNPVPRRSNKDNATDMNSFPFVRHHFLRAGSEIIDCPPLTAQLKNSSDIRMVMDVRDLLNHDTYYDEFIILSGDADFTPVLHRLRAHARRTIIYANDYTATPYTAICDGEIQEKDLINLLVTGHVTSTATAEGDEQPIGGIENQELVRTRIIDEIVVAISESDTPVPIESLADRAQRTVGHEQTIGTNWVGHGNFLTFLAENLPDHIVLSEHAPYVATDTKRMKPAAPAEAPVEAPTEIPMIAHAAPIQVQPAEAQPQAEPQAQAQAQAEVVQAQPVQAQPVQTQSVAVAPVQAESQASAADALGNVIPSEPMAMASPDAAIPAEPAQEPVPELIVEDPEVAASRQVAVATPAPSQQKSPMDATSAIQRSIANIHDACQAPPLAPPEYRAVFELISLELTENGLHGQQTVTDIVTRAGAINLEIKPDDVRFIIDVISEADPWFEQGASADLFAGRFRNFVVARCRGQGLKLSADELDLIDAWFAGPAATAQPAQQEQAPPAPMIENGAPVSKSAAAEALHGQDQAGQQAASSTVVPAATAAPLGQQPMIESGERMPEDELPRIVRSRLRG